VYRTSALWIYSSAFLRILKVVEAEEIGSCMPGGGRRVGKIEYFHGINTSNMLLDVNVCSRNPRLFCPPLTIQGSTAETLLQVGPCKRNRFPSDGAMDLDRALQRNSQHLQPRDRCSRQDFRGLRGPRPMCQVHPSQELVRRWLGRFPASRLQLQHP
jgi:hypothetical protein